MRSSSIRPRLGAIVACALTLSVTSYAGADEAAAQQAMLKAQGLLKTLAQQKSALEADLAKARAELAGKERDITTLKDQVKTKQQSLTEAQSALTESTQKTTSLDSDLSRTRERLTKTEQTLRDVVGKYKAQRATLQATELAKSELEAALAKATAELKDAETKNLALFKLNQEVMARYADKSTFDVWLQKEPLTGIKRVESENLLQEYANKNADQLRDINVDAVEDNATAESH